MKSKMFNVFYLVEGKWQPDQDNPFPVKSRKELAKRMNNDPQKKWKIRRTE